MQHDSREHWLIGFLLLPFSSQEELIEGVLRQCYCLGHWIALSSYTC